MTQKEERLPTEPIDQDAAYVSVKAGATIALPGYSSGRIDVTLSYPTPPEKIDKVYDKVKDWVDIRVEKEVKSLRELAEK